MKIRTGLCAAVFLLAAFACGAQGLRVDYAEGDSYLKRGSGWAVLSIGDTVSPNAVVRLEEGSLLEIHGFGAALVLSRPGIYAITDLLASRRALTSVGAGRALSSSFSRLRGGPSRGQDAVFGVRSERMAPEPPGWEEEGGEGPGWVEEGVEREGDRAGAETPLEEGRRLIESGRYGEAVSELSQSLTAAPEKDRAEMTFEIACALSASGDTREALKAAAAVRADGSEPWAPDFLLLQARLLVDTFAFGPAVRLLTDGAGGLSGDPPRAGTYHFLLGLAYRGLRDLPAEKESLSRVVALEGDSDLGVAARRLLENP